MNDFVTIGSNNDVVAKDALTLLKMHLLDKGYTEDQLQKYEMRSIVKLDNNGRILTFAFSKSSGVTMLPTERLLEQADSYAFNLVRILNAKSKLSASGVPHLSAADWNQFPSPAVYTGAVVAPSVLDERMQIKQLYKANLDIQTAGDPAITDFPTDILEFAPIGNSVATAVNGTGVNGEYEGWQRLMKKIFWGGGKSNEVKLKVFTDADTSAWAGTATDVNYVAVELLGFRIKNGMGNTITGDILNEGNCSQNFGLI